MPRPLGRGSSLSISSLLVEHPGWRIEYGLISSSFFVSALLDLGHGPKGENVKKALIVAALLSLTFAVPVFAAEGGQTPNAQSQAVALFQQGDGLLQDGKYEEARKAFAEAIALNPNYVEAYDSLGKVLILQLKYDEASKEFTKAINLAPDDYTAYFNRGVAYYHLGKYDEVVHDFTEVIRLYPKNHAAYNLRGIAYFEQGKLDDAIRDYSKAIELNPGYAKAYNNRAIAYMRQGKTAEAERDFVKSGQPMSGSTGTPSNKCAF
jgi:tetratricopeptide (TPR) repeat protein